MYVQLVLGRVQFKPRGVKRTLSHIWLREWGNMQLPMWGHCLWWGVHRGNIKDPGERYKEHLKQPSPILVHIQQTGHNSTANNFNIIGREEQGLAWTIKETIYIRVNNPTLNRNIHKYNLNHIWDRVLFNTPGLKLDFSPNQLHRHNNGQAQTNLANSQLQAVIGHSGHALNSEHALRES